MDRYKVIGGAIQLTRKSPYRLGETFSADNVNGRTPAEREARLEQLIKGKYCVLVEQGPVSLPPPPATPPADSSDEPKADLPPDESEVKDESKKEEAGKPTSTPRAEIRAELDARGVKYDKTAKTPELFKLLEDTKNSGG